MDEYSLVHHGTDDGMRLPTILTSLLTALLGGSMLSVSISHFMVPLAMATGGLVLVHRWPKLALRQLDIVVFFALAFFAISTIGIGTWHDEVIDALLLAWPTLIAMPALALLLLYPPRLSWVWGGLAMGGVSSGAWAIWQKVFHGVERVAGHVPVNAILFGNLSLLTGIMCLAGFGWALSRCGRLEWVFALSCGALGGLLASLLSGSRGGWVALPLMLLVLYRGYSRDLSRYRRLAGLGFFTVMVVGFYFVQPTGVQDRIDQAIEGVVVFLEGDERVTSVSARVDMWRIAGGLIIDHPLKGHGAEGYQMAVWERIGRGEANPMLGQFWHAHNDFLDTWAKRGLSGLLALLILYATPLWIFGRRLDDADPNRRSLAMAGLLLPIAFIDFGMTYSFMAYPIGVTVYSCWLIMLWSAWRIQKGVEK